MQLEGFNEKATKVIEELKAAKPKETMIIHHDDADGLCSAAITKRTLEREEIKVKTFCLEKVYTEVIGDLHSKLGQTIFYVDIGSPHADLISKYNKGRNLTVILDHHDPKPSKDPKVLDLNLEHFGFKGETEYSRAIKDFEMHILGTEETEKDLKKRREAVKEKERLDRIRKEAMARKRNKK